MKIYGGSQLTSNDNVIKQNPFQVSLQKQDRSIFLTKGLLEERHNALDTKQLREVYFEVSIKS